MWRCLAATSIGSAHQKLGTACQDVHEVRRFNHLGRELTAVAISDGAGSAEFAEVGAQVATQQWCEILEDSEFTDIDDLQVEAPVIVEEIRGALQDYAAYTRQPLASFHCTLLGAVFDGHNALFVQIGDGAWVADTVDGLEAVTWPFCGQYVGETVFVTTADLSLHLQVRVVSGVRAAAGFTDGLQGLALDLRKRLVHAPFFRPMLEGLRASPESDDLKAALEAFLSSEAVLQRTDDDKTLALLVNDAASL